MIFLLLQTLTDISQFLTKFLVPTIRLITVDDMSLKIVKKMQVRWYQINQINQR